MVERASRDVQFQTGAASKYAVPTAGSAPVSTKQVSNTIYVQGRYDNTAQRIVGDLIGKSIGQMGQAQIEASQEKAYLEGAAQLGQIDSEAQLEGNVLTRDWAVSGYRGAAFKLKLAEQQGALSEEIGTTLREKSPEEFQARLAKARADLLPQLEGLALADRKSALGQLASWQDVAIKEHTREHAKYTIDVTAQATSATLSASLTDIEKARTGGSPGDYASATNAMMAKIQGIWVDPKLPQNIKHNLLGEVAESAILGGDVALWGAIKELPVDVGDGKTDTLFNRLPLKVQNQLAERARMAADRNMTADSMAYQETLAKTEAGLQAGIVPTYDDFKALVDQGVRGGQIRSGGQINSLWQQYYTAQGKHYAGAQLANAYANGDHATIDASGRTREQARDAYIDTMFKNGATTPQVMTNLISNGLTTGNNESFKPVAGYIAPVMAKLMTGADIRLSPEEDQRLALVANAVSQAEQLNRPEAKLALLSGLPDEQRIFFETTRAFMKDGMDSTSALQEANKLRVRDSQFTPQERAAISATKAKTDTDAVAKMMQVSGVGGAGPLNSILSFMGSSSAQVQQQMSRQGNTERVSAALTEELAQRRLTNPSAKDEARMDAAMVAVANRLVPTGDNMLVMPQGTSLQSFFGVAANVSKEEVGKALAKTTEGLRQSKDSTVYYEPGVGQSVRVSETNADGVRIGSYIIQAKDVAPAIEAARAKELQKTSRVFGGGLDVVKDGVKINFNGMSSTGTDPNLMYKFRKNLVQNEGVRNVPYKDTQGNVTVGVGITNPKYMPTPGPDGKVSDAEINRTFELASNDAANAAAKISNATGLRGGKWFLLFGELAYQSGTSFNALPAYQGMLSASSAGNADAALAQLKKTPAYKMSGPERKQHYETLLLGALKG